MQSALLVAVRFDYRGQVLAAAGTEQVAAQHTVAAADLCDPALFGVLVLAFFHEFDGASLGFLIDDFQFRDMREHGISDDEVSHVL